jgi:hypothetical protein
MKFTRALRMRRTFEALLEEVIRLYFSVGLRGVRSAGARAALRQSITCVEGAIHL